MASRAALAELGVEPDEIRGLAIANLKRQLPEIGFVDRGPVLRIVTGGELEEGFDGTLFMLLGVSF